MNESTLMQDGQEIDFTQFYHQDSDAPKTKGNQNGSSNDQKKESDPTRTGQVLDMMTPYTHGTYFFCLLPDKVLTNGSPRLFRKVTKAFEGRVHDPDSENDKFMMNVQIPRPEDFQVALTTEQRNLIQNLRAQANNFSEFTDFKNKGKFPTISAVLPKLSFVPQTIFTYGKLIKVISPTAGEVTGPEIGHVRVMKFAKGELGKGDFATVLNNAIQNKISALGSSAWMRDYFNRDEAKHSKVVSVNVSQGSGTIKKYSLGVTLEEVAPYDVTKEDLEVANNLNERVFDISKFDEQYYDRLRRAFENVQRVVSSLV